MRTGETYISYGNGRNVASTIKKAKMAYASAEEFDNYFEEIRAKYKNYDYNTLIIGSKKKLTSTEIVPSLRKSYSEIINRLKPKFNKVSAILGENTYLLDPIKVDFSIDESSSVLFLGSDKNIASSLCSSVALSLINSKQGQQKKEVPPPRLVERACLKECHRMLFWREKEKRQNLKKKYKEASDLSS